MTVMRSRWGIVLLAALATPAFAQETVVEFDQALTRVNFTLASVLHTVHGTFRLKSGSIRFDTATGKAGGELVVDATSGASGSSARDKRMHRDILESAQYPEFVFAPDRVEGKLAPSGTSLLRVHGVFRIHGAGHEITVPVEANMSQGQVTAAARFTVPYVKWGMKNPSSFLLRVSDHVDIEVETAGRIATPPGGTPVTAAR